MKFTEKEKEIMKHYKIPERVEEGEQGVIIFASKNTTSVAIGEIVSRYAKTQQTIIDYDESRDEYVFRFFPRKYGDMDQTPQVNFESEKSRKCPCGKSFLKKGTKISELL